MAKSKNRSKPSHYPLLAFHGLRACSLVSSLVVASILSYFVYQLKVDHFKIPWTFLVLLGVSLLSLLALCLTMALHLCHSLSPLLSLIINILLLLLWILGLSLLGWNMAGTLGHICNPTNWGSATGIMVCRVYKALFTFTLLAGISAFALVVLDIRVRRKQNSLGKYDQMPDSSYNMKPTRENNRSGAIEGHHDEHTEAWQREGQEPDGYSDQTLSRERIRSEHFGYTSPSEQTHYDAGNYGARDRLR